VSDNLNPGHLLRVDPATGETLQSITLTTADFGTPYMFNYAGLQILGAGMTLGSTAVPAGSMLVFNGYPSNDRVIAINPSSGAVLGSLTLGANYDLTAGVFDAASGHLFVTELNGAGNRLIELNAATGALVNAITLPFNTSSYSGLAIDPVSHNLWLGATGGANQLVELTRSGAEVRRIDVSLQGINNSEITGLAFAPDGKLLVSSTQGVVYRISVA
jgi:ligand-binding sensor domain-containing protein